MSALGSEIAAAFSTEGNCYGFIYTTFPPLEKWTSRKASDAPSMER